VQKASLSSGLRKIQHTY